MKRNNTTTISGLRRTRLSIAVGGALCAGMAAAQDVSPRPAGVEEVTVTGSRITRDGMSSPTPITAITAEDMQMMAPGQIIDSLDYLPPFFMNDAPDTAASKSQSAGAANVNLRGLGAKRTLVLLDGRRMVPSNRLGAVDINLFPEAMVERVEVVTGGASAVYGTDAVAGVVELHFEGRLRRLRHSHASRRHRSRRRREQGGVRRLRHRASASAATSWRRREWFDAHKIETLEGRDWFQHWGLIQNPGAGPRDLVRPDVVSYTYTAGGLINSTLPGANAQADRIPTAIHATSSCPTAPRSRSFPAISSAPTRRRARASAHRAAATARTRSRTAAAAGTPSRTAAARSCPRPSAAACSRTTISTFGYDDAVRAVPRGQQRGQQRRHAAARHRGLGRHDLQRQSVLAGEHSAAHDGEQHSVVPARALSHDGRSRARPVRHRQRHAVAHVRRGCGDPERRCSKAGRSAAMRSSAERQPDHAGRLHPHRPPARGDGRGAAPDDGRDRVPRVAVRSGELRQLRADQSVRRRPRVAGRDRLRADGRSVHPRRRRSRTSPSSRWRATSATAGARARSRSRSAAAWREESVDQTLGPDDIIALSMPTERPTARRASSNTVDLLNPAAGCRGVRGVPAQFSATPNEIFIFTNVQPIAASIRSRRCSPRRCCRSSRASAGVEQLDLTLVGALRRLRRLGRHLGMEGRPRLADPRRRAVAHDAVARHSCGDVVGAVRPPRRRQRRSTTRRSAA